ncbi:hypothetical protein BPOR_0744g00020 [Botrytis porri]|uniref:Uncharacterized protein n=1 Tax=Botrytis porri TaxID=87229 RepID=A0A4Z1KBT2_9HELO|nr:hypothetical protein BPOR_0744g00020 [Botrytis porri]
MEVRPNHLVQHDASNIPPTESCGGSISLFRILLTVDIPTFIRPDKVTEPPPTKSNLFLPPSSLPSSSYTVRVSTASISSTPKDPSKSLYKDPTLHIWRFRWSRRKLLPHALNVVDPAAALQQRPNITIKEEFSKFHNRAIRP